MEGSQAASRATGSHSLGKYRLIAELGHGGMAEVYLAVVRGPAGFNKLVVIKQIRPQLAEDPEFLGMFLDEARLAARLSHPNVVQTNEVGQEGERYFIAMEYLEGQPLNRIIHRLQKAGSITLGMHVKIIADALAGLHHAHELTDYDGTPLGVVHRDVTPHNVFVTYDGVVKVVDFGIAKALNSSSETRTGVLKGKVAYMAPEQARGERVDRRADIFSVGVMLWEAATGKRMWKGVPDITILQRLLSGEIPTPRSVKPEVPEALEAIILKALAHQREDRYETAADLQVALEKWVAASGETAHSREIGKAIAASFEADRAKIKGIIDEQLRSNKTGLDVTSAALPVIDQHTSSGPNSSRGGDRGSLSSISEGSAPSASSKVEIIGAGSSSTSYTGPLFASTASNPGETGGSKRGLVVAAAIAAGAVLAIVFWQFTKSPPAPVATASTNAATAGGAPTSAPSVSDVEISVSANPPEAKIYLDDKQLSGNPAKVKLTKDANKHELRIEAAGYTTKTESITLERDRSMDVVLIKDAGADKTAKTRVTGPVAPPPDDMRTNTKKPQRQLDTSNPYNR